MTLLLWTLWTFSVGAHGPQDEKIFASSAAKLKFQDFALGNEFVAVRTPDFRQLSLFHGDKSVAPLRKYAYRAFVSPETTQ